MGVLVGDKVEERVGDSVGLSVAVFEGDCVWEGESVGEGVCDGEVFIVAVTVCPVAGASSTAASTKNLAPRGMLSFEQAACRSAFQQCQAGSQIG